LARSSCAVAESFFALYLVPLRQSRNLAPGAQYIAAIVDFSDDAILSKKLDGTSWQVFSLFVRGITRRLHVNDVGPHIPVAPCQAEWSNLNFCGADNPPTTSSVASHDQFPPRHEETKERESREHLCSLQSHLLSRFWGSCRRRTIIEAPQAEF
jgi:hypothetical protein